jgi:hypothetical protein
MTLERFPGVEPFLIHTALANTKESALNQVIESTKNNIFLWIHLKIKRSL